MREPWGYVGVSRIVVPPHLTYTYRPQDSLRWARGILAASEEVSTWWALEDVVLPRLADALDKMSWPWQGHLHGESIGSIVLRFGRRVVVVRRLSSLLRPMEATDWQDAHDKIRMIADLWSVYHDHLLEPDKPRWAATLPGLARIGLWARVEQSGWLSWRDQRLTRAAYYGGRTEVYRIRAERAYYVDRNAAYVQHYGDTYPLGEPRIMGQVEAQAAFALGEPGMYQAIVTTPETAPYGPVPYRGHTETGYYLGEVGGWYWSPDLECAREAGSKIEIFGALLWNRWGRPLLDVQRWAYQLRKDTALLGPDWAAWGKAVTVAMAGVMAPRRERYRLHRLRPGETPRPCTCGQTVCSCGGWLPLDRGMEYWLIPELSRSPSPVAPHWAGLLTARARRVLWQAMRTVPPESLIYVDTDCVIATERPIVDGETWKSKTIRNWRAVGARLYSYDDDQGHQGNYISDQDGALEVEISRLYGVRMAQTAANRWEHQKTVTARMRPSEGVILSGRRLTADGTTEPIEPRR